MRYIYWIPICGLGVACIMSLKDDVEIMFLNNIYHKWIYVAWQLALTVIIALQITT